MDCDISATLSLFEDLTNDELREIVSNDEKLDELLKGSVQSIDASSAIESDKEALLIKNRSLAEENLALEPQLMEKKEELRELLNSAQELHGICEEKLNELNSKRDKLDVDKALELLQAASVEIEEESEKSAEKLLDKELEVEDFLEQFLTTRKLMHLRKVKADKMKDLISRRSLNYENVRGPPGSANPYYPPISNSIPYPMNQPMFMPFPSYH